MENLDIKSTFDALGASRNLTIIAAYHDYSAAHGTGTLGHELNLDTTLRINEYWRLDADYAAYDGTPGFASRNKFCFVPHCGLLGRRT